MTDTELALREALRKLGKAHEEVCPRHADCATLVEARAVLARAEEEPPNLVHEAACVRAVQDIGWWWCELWHSGEWDLVWHGPTGTGFYCPRCKHTVEYR